MKKASIKMIADALGLSRNTVSKALSNNDSVADDTRQRVVRKAIEIGYKKISPDIEMERLVDKIKKRQNILVLAKRDVSSFWDEIALGIFDKTDSERFNVLYHFVSEEEEDDLVMPPNLKSEKIAGIIFLNIFSPSYLAQIQALQVPLVFLDSPKELDKTLEVGDVVLVEGYQKIYEITNNMIKNGRYQLAFIGDPHYCQSIYERFRGFKQAVIDNDITEVIEITNHVKMKYYVYEEVEEALESLETMPKGIVCANDDIAIFVLNYCKKKGLLVPSDVEISGFDNKRDYIHIEPSFTTVEVNKNALGARLAQELVWRLSNPEMPTEIITVHTDLKFGLSSPRYK